MIVNLYVDHLMSSPASSAEEVWYATHQHARVFTEAARQIGLTGSEYQEFRDALLDGRALYVKLPRRLDAMSVDHHGYVYSIRNAVVTGTALGWKVSLRDGTEVYVPQTCGNISLLHRSQQVAKHQSPVFHESLKVAPPVPEQPVALVAPAPEVPVAVPATAAETQIVPAAAGHGFGFLPLLPFVGGLFSIPGGGAPNCSGGSNAAGACSK
ncbi:MAG: hypothetical protein WAJ85_08475 [Candidatus Baltobacteraceae bacterium]|jgi:hypothetical protein